MTITSILGLAILTCKYPASIARIPVSLTTSAKKRKDAIVNTDLRFIVWFILIFFKEQITIAVTYPNTAIISGGTISCGTKLHARNIPAKSTTNHLRTSNLIVIFLYWLFRFIIASLRNAPSSFSFFTLDSHTTIINTDVSAKSGNACIK